MRDNRATDWRALLLFVGSASLLSCGLGPDQPPSAASDASVTDADAGKGACNPDLSGISELDDVDRLNLEVLAVDQPIASSVLLHAGVVYWANSFSRGQIRSVSPTDCMVRDVVPRIDQPKNLVADDESIYWVEAASARLMSYRFDTKEVAVLSSDIWYQGLVPMGNSVYALGRGCVVTETPKQGGTTVVRTATLGAMPRFIAGDGEALIFGCQDVDAIFEFRPQGNSLRRLLVRPQPMTALDVTATHIVWGEANCPDYLQACYPQPLPGCCAGRILAYDRLTSETSTVTIDAATPPFSLAMDGKQLWWSNISEIRSTTLGESTSRRVASSQGIVDAIAFDDRYVYWANARRAYDTYIGPGYVVRTPRMR
jgi:hypothetical protein